MNLVIVISIIIFCSCCFWTVKCNRQTVMQYLRIERRMIVNKVLFLYHEVSKQNYGYY